MVVGVTPVSMQNSSRDALMVPATGTVPQL